MKQGSDVGGRGRPAVISGTEHYLREEIYRRVREEPGLFDFLQERCMDGLCYWDLERPEHKWINPRFWRLLGYHPDEQPPLASVWKERVFEEDLDRVLADLERHKSDPEHPYDQVIRYRHKNGSTVWMRCRGMVIHDQQGRPTRLLGVHTDITALKETETELLRKKEQLEHINEELRQFAYSASHDLQAPLNTISNHLTLLQNLGAGGDDSKSHELMDHVIGAAGRLKAVIGGLMGLARLNDIHGAASEVDCNRLLGDLLRDLEHSIVEGGATVEWELLPAVYGVPTLLRQLFQNLIGNALKYARPGVPPVIRIGALELPDHWAFTVADNGIGIEPRHQHGIFDLFQRLHTWSEIEGTGLGLSLCRKIVQIHNGHLWVESEPGEGSTFHFTLPKPAAVGT